MVGNMIKKRLGMAGLLSLLSLLSSVLPSLLLAMTMQCPGQAWAQEGKPSREREALRRAQQALRSAKEEASTLQRDKTQLAQEKDLLAKDKERAVSETRKVASRLEGAVAQTRQAQGRIASLEGELSAAKLALEAEKEAGVQLGTQLGAQLAESKRLVAATRDMLAHSTQVQHILTARNQQLYDIGTKVVEMYRSRKPSETLSRQEPFFNLGVVTLENISDTWQDRLEAARYLEQDKLSP
jgi:DNA repair exonuclease SbcCD ATPase subunit